MCISAYENEFGNVLFNIIDGWRKKWALLSSFMPMFSVISVANDGEIMATSF